MTNDQTAPVRLMVRRYFSAQEDDFDFHGPFESEEEACLHWPADATEYVRIISVLVPIGVNVEVVYSEVSTEVDEETLLRSWGFEDEAL